MSDSSTRRSPRCAVCRRAACWKCMACNRWACPDHKGDLPQARLDGVSGHHWRGPGSSKTGKPPLHAPRLSRPASSTIL